MELSVQQNSTWYFDFIPAFLVCLYKYNNDFSSVACCGKTLAIGSWGDEEHQWMVENWQPQSPDLLRLLQRQKRLFAFKANKHNWCFHANVTVTIPHFKVQHSCWECLSVVYICQGVADNDTEWRQHSQSLIYDTDNDRHRMKTTFTITSIGRRQYYSLQL